ncbi:MAG: hypothetical protein U0Q18_06150 [Bryobacteraceae bacterium]
MQPDRPARSVLWAAVSALAVLSWQVLTVHYNYGGNWTALFCTGGNLKTPPQLAGENLYRFQNSNGWDGQFYHYIAHDPTLANGMARYIDAPRLRYRRILIPALAFLLAGGSQSHIDCAYRVVILFFFALGGYWLSRLAQCSGYHAAWGLAVVLIPASLVSMDRMALDIGLVACCLGLALYSEAHESAWKLYAVLVCAGLVRDTGWLLIAAYVLWLLRTKQFGRALVFGTTTAPALAWYAFVYSRTPNYQGPGALAMLFSGIADRLLHPVTYALPAFQSTIASIFDFVALTGILVAFVLAVLLVRRAGISPTSVAAILFLLLGVLIWRPNDWVSVYDYGRILSPLLIFLALHGVRSHQWAWLTPLAMVTPRVGVQLALQVIGVARGLMHFA